MAMSQNNKSVLVWVAIIIVFLAIYHAVSTPDRSAPKLDAFFADAEAGRVAAVRIQPDSSGERAALRVQRTDGRVYATQAVALKTAIEAAHQAGLDFTLEPARFPVSLEMLAQWVPILALVGLMWLFFHQLKKSSGKSNPTLVEMTNARLAVKDPPPGATTGPAFTDDENRFLEAVKALKDGRDGPRRILLAGPTGSGKTRLLKNAVSAAGVKWLPLPASDVGNVFVGMAAGRIRRAFELAAAAAPCVLALEDLDALAARRVLPGNGKAQEEGQLTEQVQGMIELCQYLDGLREFPKGVLFVATTNRPDRLDEAIARPGRIELRIELPAPAARSA